MTEYIDREVALSLIQPDAPEDEKSTVTIATAKKLVRSIVYRTPTADVAPVRHGKWVRIGIKGRKGLPIYPCCSACGMVSAAFRSEWEGLRGAWKYCPNCGAKMDEPVEEDK